jgi:hypothetical protein
MTLSYWYFISNRATRQCVDLVADSPEAACREIRWQQGDCVVIMVGEMANGEGAARAGIPRQTPVALPDPKRHQLR